MKVGVLGGGQLGRMLALAGYPLGLQFRFFDTIENAPASQLAESIVGSYDDLDGLKRFASGVDVVTYEFENVPVAAAKFLQQCVPVFPTPNALEIAQDRYSEKEFFTRLEIPTTKFFAIDSLRDLQQAVAAVGFPSVLKTRRLGYDGKGQLVLRRASEVEGAWNTLRGSPLILEEFIPFEREVSVLAVRNRSGEHAFYPLVENTHDGGILRLSRSPSEALFSLQAIAEGFALRVCEALNYVGVLAIEFFVHKGNLIANEMAPRVHNSGHLTIEGSSTSQFENHLRAILDMPLGSKEPTGFAAMLNIIGEIPDVQRILQIPNAHLHLYGKTPRAGRKLGHITTVAKGAEELAEQINALQNGLPLS
jgi:5-(carboxyamino)imidazole ribonucleotide synthase